MWLFENLKSHMRLVFVAHRMFLLDGAPLGSHQLLMVPPPSSPLSLLTPLCHCLPRPPNPSLSRALFTWESPALWVLGFIKDNHDHSVDSFKDPGKEAPTCGQSTGLPLCRAVEKDQKTFCLSKEHNVFQIGLPQYVNFPHERFAFKFKVFVSRRPLLKQVAFEKLLKA